jgi:hypothetical protein
LNNDKREPNSGLNGKEEEKRRERLMYFFLMKLQPMDVEPAGTFVSADLVWTGI